MTAGSCSVAIRRSRPPQSEHARTSIANARCISAAQVQPGGELFSLAPPAPLAGERYVDALRRHFSSEEDAKQLSKGDKPEHDCGDKRRRLLHLVPSASVSTLDLLPDALRDDLVERRARPADVGHPDARLALGHAGRESITRRFLAVWSEPAGRTPELVGPPADVMPSRPGEVWYLRDSLAIWRVVLRLHSLVGEESADQC
jgi:hypothetical protein